MKLYTMDEVLAPLKAAEKRPVMPPNIGSASGPGRLRRGFRGLWQGFTITLAIGIILLTIIL